MRNLVVFVDLFSLLAIALFIAFATSVGSGGANDELNRPVVIELTPVLSSGGTPTSAEGFVTYRAVITDGDTGTDITSAVDLVEQHSDGLTRYVVRDPPANANLDVLISYVSPKAFSFDSHKVTLTRVYPTAASVTSAEERVGAACVSPSANGASCQTYEIALQ